MKVDTQIEGNCRRTILLSARVFVEAENGSVEVLESVALFLLMTETCDAKNFWKFFVDDIFCFVKIGFDKKRDKYKVSLMNGSSLILPCIQSAQSCSSCIVPRTVFAVGFWLLRFLQLKLWARIPLQIGDSPPTVFLYLSVNFHKCVSVAQLRLNLTSYLCSEFYGHDWLQTYRCKTRQL